MVMQKLSEEIDKGLSKEAHDQSSVKCFPTYVQDLPDGSGKWESMIFCDDSQKSYCIFISSFCNHKKRQQGT